MTRTYDILCMGRNSIDLYANDVGAPFEEITSFAALVGGYGFEQLRPLLQFVVALYAACAFHVVVVYPVLLLLHGLNPWKFFRGAASGMRATFTSDR